MQRLITFILFALLGVALACLNTSDTLCIQRPSYWVALVCAGAIYLTDRLM
jgi:hypothetical protein